MKGSLRLVFFTLGLLSANIPLQASHIVGGEFELLHLQDFSYRLSLILYSDNINIIDPAAIDPSAEVHIYRKSDNVLLRVYVLPKLAHTQVPYTNPDCVIPELSTSKVVYSANVVLDAEEFNDPGGYYISYERCCRNGVIKNIIDPGGTGQAFYMEFPAVVDEEGQQFINSAPYLFPPLSDFARLGYPFYFDFSGTDADGDSLVYSLATPLAGFSSTATGNVLPPPRPGPYPEILWAPGYSRENSIPGEPGGQFRIDTRGLLNITPTQEGIYVFSVLVEEYRDKQKIGEIRRDFQMLVYDFAGSDFPPVLSVQAPNSSIFTNSDLHLTDADFPGYGKDDLRCVQLKITDQDMGMGNYNERIKIRVRPVNFPREYAYVFEQYSGVINPDEPELFVDFCLPACPPRSDTYIFDVVAYDDACAVPLTDTLRISANFESLENTAPVASTSLNNTANAEAFIQMDQPIEFTVESSDFDDHPMLLQMQGFQFDPNALGMEFTPVQGNGPLQSTFRWTPTCDLINLDMKNEFELLFIATEQTDCPIPYGDTVGVTIQVAPRANQAPQLSIADLATQSVEVIAGESLQVKVMGKDADKGDLMYMRLLQVEPANIPLRYSWQDMQGQTVIASDLLIAPDCDLLSSADSVLDFTFTFALSDDVCFNQKSDTLQLAVQVRDQVQDFDRVKYTNVFTPNGDEFNPVFEIQNLPPDRCDNRFEEVVVVNRWGREVYRSAQRDFRWDGGNAASGTYFYILRYTQDEYRSPLTIIRGDRAGAN